MKLKFANTLTLLIAITLLFATPLYAKGGADDSAGDDNGSSSSNSSSSQSRESEQRGQEAEQRGQEAEVRGQEPEARGQEAEARGRSAEGEIENQIEIENEIEQNNQSFEVSGKISSISGNSFMINGKTIIVDPSQVVNFQQTAPLEANSSVKVEGIIVNGTFFAREIKPLIETSVSNSGSRENSGKDNSDDNPGRQTENRGRNPFFEIENFFGRLMASIRNLLFR